MKLETDTNVETYVNNTKKENLQSNNSSISNSKDDTVASGRIPQTGVSIGIILSIVLVLIGGAFAYFKYNKLKEI